MNSETINFFMVSLRYSKFITLVQVNDAGAEVEVFDLLESRVFQHALQALLVGVHADGFGEITIVRFVACYRPAQPGKNLERVPVVDLRERPPDAGALEHEHPATGLEHAAHFGERRV